MYSGLGFVATLHGLVGHHHGLAGVAGELFVFDHCLVEAHLGLLLMSNDVGGLLFQALMLVFRLANRLLELHLRVGVLLELRIGLGR